MIPDGYSQSAEIGHEWFHFRPMVRVQRESLLEYLRDIPEQAARAITIDALTKQILVRDKEELRIFFRSQRNSDIEDFLQVVAGDPATQAMEAENLRQSVQLLQYHPHLLSVTCSQCRHWWYNPHDGVVAKRDGQPLRRPEGSVVPCETYIGCPKGTYSKPIVVMKKNELAWKHYRQCQSIGRWPDDSIVAQNAAIIRSALNWGGK